MRTFKISIQDTASASQARYTTYASILWFVSKDGITYKVAELCALKFVAEKARELGMVERWKDLCSSSEGRSMSMRFASGLKPAPVSGSCKKVSANVTHQKQLDRYCERELFCV
jgi:hypothetical protein